MTMYPIQSRNNSQDNTHQDADAEDALFFEIPEHEEEEEDQGSTFTFDLSNSFNTTGRHPLRGEKLHHTTTNDGRCIHAHEEKNAFYRTQQPERCSSRAISPLVSPGKNQETYGFQRQSQAEAQDDSAIFNVAPHQDEAAEREQHDGSNRWNDASWLSDICSEDSQSELDQSIWGDPRKLLYPFRDYANDLELSINLNGNEHAYLSSQESEHNDAAGSPRPCDKNSEVHREGAKVHSQGLVLPNHGFASTREVSPTQHSQHNVGNSAPESEEFSYVHPMVQTSGFGRFRGAYSGVRQLAKTLPFEEQGQHPHNNLNYPRVSPIPSSHEGNQSVAPSAIQEDGSHADEASDAASNTVNGTVANAFSSTTTAQPSHGQQDDDAQTTSTMSSLPPSGPAEDSFLSNGRKRTHKTRTFLHRRKPVSHHARRDTFVKNNYALPNSRLRQPSHGGNVQRAQTAGSPKDSHQTNANFFEEIPIRTEQNDMMVQSVRSSECTSRDNKHPVGQQQSSNDAERQPPSNNESATSARTEKSSNLRMEYDKAVRQKNRAKMGRNIQDNSSKKEKKINKLIDMLMRERPVNMPAEQLKSQVLERLKDEENSRRAEEVNLEMKSAKEKQDFQELKRLLLEEEREKSSAKNSHLSRGQSTQGLTLSSKNVTTGQSVRERISKKERDKDTASELSSFLETASTECDEDSPERENDADAETDQDIFNNAQRFERRKAMHPFDRNRELLSQSSAKIAERQLLDSLAEIDEKLNARQAAIRDSRKRELQYRLSDPRQNAEKEDSHSGLDRKPSLSSVAKNMLDDFTGTKHKPRPHEARRI
eukprot:gb/GECG01005739.1/.p1 GENE.gb/GECG01005739.1/~~gb/GECG01005739.1/.p1  ORF type:complete len:821 (+),score=126.15 gb/GECG01005739.1/:1-2463(+)